jgi:hypothetical protein
MRDTSRCGCTIMTEKKKIKKKKKQIAITRGAKSSDLSGVLKDLRGRVIDASTFCNILNPNSAVNRNRGGGNNNRFLKIICTRNDSCTYVFVFTTCTNILRYTSPTYCKRVILKIKLRIIRRVLIQILDFLLNIIGLRY